jgi:S-adenosyl-L-methionine hydrolase (adenosine-forming)
VTQDLFHKVGHGRPFQLYFKRHDPITSLSTHYNDVAIGETLCLFNSDYLEITINMGKAAEMLGLKVEDTIQIDFLSEEV